MRVSFNEHIFKGEGGADYWLLSIALRRRTRTRAPIQLIVSLIQLLRPNRKCFNFSGNFDVSKTCSSLDLTSHLPPNLSSHFLSYSFKRLVIVVASM